MDAPPATTGLTYDDLQRCPDDRLRREIIGGALHVTAAPALRHQVVVARLVRLLGAHADEHGGEVFPAPTDVFFTEQDVVEPDVVYVSAARADRLEERFVRGAPDLVVEVSSPGTRRVDLTRKRDLYERHDVPEYWVVDLDADRVEVHRLEAGRYGTPTLLGRDKRLSAPLLPGVAVAVAELVAAPGARPDQV